MKEALEKIRGHKLLTKELLKRFEAIGSQEQNPDPLVICKFFDPNSRWTWYATEYLPEDDLFFGLIIGFEAELGYFSYQELQETKSKLGLPLERDLSFNEQRLSEIKKHHGIE